MKTEKTSTAMPAEIANLPSLWQQIWCGLPDLVNYGRICSTFGYKNPKSASAALCSDPDAPRPIFVGRAALFDKTALVRWAYGRAQNAHKRGCHARKENGNE